MKHRITYLLIIVEEIIMATSFILGIGAAESDMYLLSVCLMIAPAIWGWCVDINSHLHFLEVYDRAFGISLSKKKANKI